MTCNFYSEIYNNGLVNSHWIYVIRKIIKKKNEIIKLVSVIVDKWW